MKKFIMITVMVLMVSLVFGTKVYLKNGKVFNGQIRGKSENQIIIYSGASNTYFGVKFNDIQKILSDNNIDITRETIEIENYQDEINFSKYFEVNGTETSNYPKTFHVETKYPPEEQKDRFNSRYPNKHYKYKIDPKFALISLSFTALSWDYFSTSSNLNQSINNFNELGLETSKLEKEKNRKNILGATFAVSAIFTAVLSLEKIEIKASPTSVSLGYRF